VAVRPLQAALVRLLAEFELHAAGVGVPLSDAFVLPSAACIAWRNVVLFVAFFPASTVTPGGTSTELSSIPPIFSTWNRANWSACCVVVIDSRVRTSISNKYSSFRPLEPAHRTRFDAATSGFQPLRERLAVVLRRLDVVTVTAATFEQLGDGVLGSHTFTEHVDGDEQAKLVEGDPVGLS